MLRIRVKQSLSGTCQKAFSGHKTSRDHNLSCHSIESWLVNRDPKIMAVHNQKNLIFFSGYNHVRTHILGLKQDPYHNWVVVHPLDTASNQGRVNWSLDLR